jgi:hypothetical protein
MAQQAPAYQANPDASLASRSEVYVETFHDTFSNCTTPSENGVRDSTGTGTTSSFGPDFDQSVFPLITQGGKWIPASGTSTYPSADGTFTTTYASALSASGIVTTTLTETYLNSPVSGGGTTTGTYIETETLELPPGTSSTWKSHGVYSIIGTNIPDVAGTGTCTVVQNDDYDKTGTAALTLQPYVTRASVTLVDPAIANGVGVPFPTSVDPNSVPNAPAVNRISADGSSAAAIVYRSSSSKAVTFSISAAGTTYGDGATGDIGGITDFDKTYLTTLIPGQMPSLTVSSPLDSTTCNANTDTAGTSNCTFIAILWSPPTMPYSSALINAMTPEPYTITLTANQVTANGVQGVTSTEAQLLPPPVVLVHGIWSDAKHTWPQFETWLDTHTLSGVFEADYKNYNYLAYYDQHIQTVLQDKIADALDAAAYNNTIARKVDVIAHSMGGLGRGPHPRSSRKHQSSLPPHVL